VNRQELVQRAKAIIAEAYEEAAELVAEYVERTGEPLQSLCKEIDPDNWNALRQRVQRAQAARKAASDAASVRSPSHWTEAPEEKRRVRSALKNASDDAVEDIVASLPAEAVERVAKAVERHVPPTRRGFTTEPRPRAAEPSLFARFAQQAFALWALQDELQDIALEPDERGRLLDIVRATRRFLDAAEVALDTGSFDEGVAEMLAEVQASGWVDR
jgi:hypothetical protein